MRTLKKVLALTIALATLFSLTAFAAYKDESAIASETMSAVNLVNSLKIMTGDTKGNFNPTATITRAEAAKMVYVVRTGGNTNADGWKGQNIFTDTKGHWAEGFINYCASVGIIAGVGNNKFNPEGKLTGVELAKMLLVAAGYKADIQGYTGSAWQGKVLADAEAAGLFEGYAPAYVGAAPRQYAAVMFNNCLLRTNMAVYLSDELVTGTLGNAVLVGTKYFKLTAQTGDLTAAGKGFTMANASTLPLDVKTPVAANFAAPADLLYQQVKVVFNGTTGEIYDMYATGLSKVYNVHGSDIKLTETTAAAAGTAQVMTLELPGYAKTTYTAAAPNTNVGVKYVKTGNTAPTQDFATVKTAATQNNDAFRFIDTNGDGKVETVVQFAATYGIVEKNSTTTGLVIKTAATVADKDAYADVNFKDTVAVGDVIRYYTDLAGTKVVEKITAIVGTPTVKSAAGVYTVAGTQYSFAATTATTSLTAMTLGTEYKMYTDGKYLICVTSATEGPAAPTTFSENFCLVLNSAAAVPGTTFTAAVPAKVQVLLATGETKIYDYVDIDGDSATVYQAAPAAGALNDKVQQYELKDGKISFLTAVAPIANHTYNTTARELTSYASNVLTVATDLNVVNGVIRTDANSYFFVKYDTAAVGDPAVNKYAVVKASELQNPGAVTDGAKVLAFNIKNGVQTLNFGFIDIGKKAPTNNTTAAKHVIVTGAYSEELNAEGKTVYTLPVMYFDGTTGKLTMATLTEAQKAKGVYTFSVTDGKATLAADTMSTGKLFGFSDTFIMPTATTFVDLAANCQIIYMKDGAVVTEKTELYVRTGTEFNIKYEVTNNKITTLIVTDFVAKP